MTISAYLTDIGDVFLPCMDFSFMGNIVMSYENIRKLFYEDLSYMPFYKRKGEVKKVLSVKLKGFIPLFHENIEKYYDDILFQNRISIKDHNALSLVNIPIINERDSTLNEIKAKGKTAVEGYMKKFPNMKTLDYYISLVTDGKILSKYLHENTAACLLIKHSRKYISKKTVDYDDLSAILYLHYELYGFSAHNDYKYVVIDEAQDSSLFSLWILRKIFDTNRFMLVGDLTQGIYLSAGYKNWDIVRKHVFTGKEATYLTLEQSYRTTAEIMNFANEVVKLLKNPDIALAKPVVRHGEQPEIYRFDKINEALKQLNNILDILREEDFHSIAVISKSAESSRKLYGKIKDKVQNAKILTANDDLLKDGISFLPAYMAKGLEFDVVIIAEFFDDFNLSELDIKLLYVSITRALHKLYVITTGGRLNLLKG